MMMSRWSLTLRSGVSPLIWLHWSSLVSSCPFSFSALSFLCKHRRDSEGDSTWPYEWLKKLVMLETDSLLTQLLDFLHLVALTLLSDGLQLLDHLHTAVHLCFWLIHSKELNNTFRSDLSCKINTASLDTHLKYCTLGLFVFIFLYYLIFYYL